MPKRSSTKKNLFFKKSLYLTIAYIVCSAVALSLLGYNLMNKPQSTTHLCQPATHYRGVIFEADLGCMVRDQRALEQWNLFNYIFISILVLVIIMAATHLFIAKRNKDARRIAKRLLIIKGRLKNSKLLHSKYFYIPVVIVAGIVLSIAVLGPKYPISRTGPEACPYSKRLSILKNELGEYLEIKEQATRIEELRKRQNGPFNCGSTGGMRSNATLYLL